MLKKKDTFLCCHTTISSNELAVEFNPMLSNKSERTIATWD